MSSAMCLPRMSLDLACKSLVLRIRSWHFITERFLTKTKDSSVLWGGWRLSILEPHDLVALLCLGGGVTILPGLESALYHAAFPWVAAVIPPAWFQSLLSLSSLFPEMSPKVVCRENKWSLQSFLKRCSECDCFVCRCSEILGESL